ncbi:LPS biosynthesis protein [Nocardioides baekrokdamisoli]|uniref:LPS biosynthesis protein n=1 Tax=Nocardioides baekrokdamisoli TaxID=1804624 RepID=A0A3G9IYY0_9ACTN|nr:LPS biosynthesis protein [Nocardioides baekrokdamisoli]
MVVLFHVYVHTTGSVHAAIGPISRAGFVGVLFFFVLSGYLLTWGARRGVWDFYRRRFARIYPAFIASLIFGTGVLFVLGRQPGITSLLNLVLLQSWSPHQLSVNVINEPGWSLSAEAFFYALFPAAIVWVRRGSRRTLVAASMLSWVAVAVAGYLGHWSLLDDQTQEFLGRLPLLLGGAFLVGMIAARAQHEGWAPKISLRAAVASAGALYLLCCWEPMAPSANLILLPALVAVVIAAAQADLNGARSIWRTPTMLKLGAESYCLYLFHWPVLDLLARRPLALPSIWVAVLVLPIAMSLAHLVHRTVEQPAERWLRPGHDLSAADVG